MLLNKRISIRYFLNLIKWDLLRIAIYAVVIGSLDHYSVFATINIPLAVSAFIGTLLSLLLAFRTSQSYERWWEARMVWGAIVNDSRTLVRQCQLFVPQTEKGKDYVQAFARQQVTWCYALNHSLRRIPHNERVQRYQQEQERDIKHLPNHILSRQSALLHEVTQEFSIDANRQVQVDATLQRLCDAMGKCERIKNTVFPRAYSILIHFLIYVLMTVLPFGLDDKSTFTEIALTFIIPALFISIERTAILMQDPFENKPTDVSMTAICQTIEQNLYEITAIKDSLTPVEPGGDYYVM